jgi:hypothetical protein
MKPLSPWDCPFCGRLSAAEPTLRIAPQTHQVVEDPTHSKLFAVRCWYCGARGPLGGSPRQAVERWRHLAARNGVPTW